MATLNADKNKYVTSAWEVDPAGERPARRLTRSAKGEAGAAFLPSGDLLFTSARPDPDASADGDDTPALLWLLPAAGGEARVVAQRPGGVGGVKVAREAGTVLVSSDTFPSAADADADEAKRKERKEHKVTAILHEQYPIRYWDHDLGPDVPRLLVGALGDDEKVELRDLTPDAGNALVEATYDIRRDGKTVVTSWSTPAGRGATRSTLVAIDVESGQRRTIADDPDHEYYAPAISPDGTFVAAVQERLSTANDALVIGLVLVSLADGEVRELAADWDRWPSSPTWTSDGAAVLVSADDNGRRPVFRVDVATGEVTRLTSGDSAFTDIVVAGDDAFALETSYLAPSAPVRLDVRTGAQTVVPLPSPQPAPELPGKLDEVTTTTADGVTVRAWMAVPNDASATSPAPLLLWVHGGPLGSWNEWSWRWNPWLMVAKGYAVLLPDPALSTGYGQEFISRGWGKWGSAPFTDLMEMTDAVIARDDIDATRTAAMGGSFGGYMANWIAGNTNRFKAIVTHASLWSLDTFGPTTDAAWFWEREMTPEMMAANSPHHHADKIATPMLVIHGDKDYRVPIGEGVRLWYDLVSRSKNGDGTTPHKFLYFPDENHWVLTPQHAKVWYETVLAFLAHHVLSEDWEAPAILR